MVKHVVMFKLVPNVDRISGSKQIVETLEQLPGKINQIRYYELGTNFATSESAYDVVLISEFDSVEDLNAYRSHPEHVSAVEKIKHLIQKTAVVDYEC